MRTQLFLLGLLVALPNVSSAQDVEMFGERYGTRPPQVYYEQLSRDPGAFAFTRGRTARLRARMAAEAGLDPGRPRLIGPRDGPVEGTYRIPVLMGLFSDSPAEAAMPYTRDDVQTAYFGHVPGTITDFYGEISGGKVDLLGDLQDWTRGSFTNLQATAGNSGLSAGTTGPFIVQLLQGLPDVDWALYDNDGPDGSPNSGDDDGFVDALAVVQPTSGGECGGSDKDNRIWSHRWSLQSAAGTVLRAMGMNEGFATTVPAAGGGVIRVDDYVIQPLLACNGADLSEIGVFSHELGHAFGLPDLYDTKPSIEGKHAGAGNWDLMASGSYGCDGNSAESPCHMGAWSKSILGWVNVTTMPAGTDFGTLVLNPVESGGGVYRVDARDGSGDYFLLENRQRIGYDKNLYGEGMLIWHIDPAWVSQQWAAFNNVNAYAHRGVWLREADGGDDMGRPGGGRGDASDPFPWISSSGENRSFHAASQPAATSRLGTPTGVTIVDITTAGDDVTFRLLTRFTTLSLLAEGTEGTGGIFTIDGSSITGATHTFSSAPFSRHTIKVAEGESIAAGVRRPFAGWADDASALPVRQVKTPFVDSEYVARFAGRQMQLAVESTGGVNGVSPGTFSTVPASADLWFDEASSVIVEAVPTRGFGFVDWTGALAGQGNPAIVMMAAPVTAGASFELTYALPAAPVSFSAAVSLDFRLDVENGTAPVVWVVTEGLLPAGVAVDAFGNVTGAALELGNFTVTVRATDALGLQATGPLVFAVSDPGIPVAQLASHFLGVGPSLSAIQLNFLDRQGNRNGGFDLGDFRAWVLANPSLPFSLELRSLIGPDVVIRASDPAGGR